MFWTHENHLPRIHPSAFVHSSAELIGRVVIKKDASLWPMVVLRGDIETITIGERSNVQDSTVVHTTQGLPTRLGMGVTVGHGAVLHGTRISDFSLIGMGAILLDGSVIGKECLVGAGAVVPERMRIPPRSLVLGIPGKVVRRLRPNEIAELHKRAADYVTYAAQHRQTSQPISPRTIPGQSPSDPAAVAIVVLVTAPNVTEANRLSEILIRERLAACVNIIPGVASRYWWKGKIETANEFMIVIKTTPAKFAVLEKRVRQLHSYTVPEVIALPIVQASKPYLAWIVNSLESHVPQK